MPCIRKILVLQCGTSSRGTTRFTPEECNMPDSERQVWLNGHLVPESQAKVSIYDSALMFGDVVFEMTRSFNKQQFRLREHLLRLYSSMKMVRIDCGISME